MRSNALEARHRRYTEASWSYIRHAIVAFIVFYWATVEACDSCNATLTAGRERDLVSHLSIHSGTKEGIGLYAVTYNWNVALQFRVLGLTSTAPF